MHDIAHWRQVLTRNPDLIQYLTPRLTPYIPHTPTPKQTAFLLLNCREALFGGAAGGGKSDALLDAALQYVDVPGYSALILRRTYADLSLPNAIMDRAALWLSPTDAQWNDKTKTWLFPSGATLTFGYLQTERDKYRYQGTAFQFIAFDELTQFLMSQYTYLFSRLQPKHGVNVPLRMRAATNPGGIGGEWVKQRFLVEGRQHGRIFIPSSLADNPYIDRSQYELSLAELDPVTRRQLLEGDWDASYEGGLFKREWFKVVESAPSKLRRVRYWDLASTEPSSANPDPDWTVGALVGRDANNDWYVLDIQRFRLSPQRVEQLIRQTAEADGQAVEIRMEEEPGSAGRAQIEHYARSVLQGFHFKGVRPTGDKLTRAKPLASQAEAGRMFLLRGAWITEFLNELSVFPYGGHDDQVDALSGAYSELVEAKRSVVVARATGLW